MAKQEVEKKKLYSAASVLFFIAAFFFFISYLFGKEIMWLVLGFVTFINGILFTIAFKQKEK
ncbi:hypothetical protein GCM10010978_07250 [Compostibacillus humi]|mgnify:CR=1 FL=1|uniref:Uncharacterized protein n=1 Tax=Compostibacillus humi TaxID=1245525 RepID=A0A8J2ZQ69_9BACI|nr:hypothetical protein [Compostibacillus humi]GGH71378.1 hypothetical protein GCM10010978_07250 [Compostibacillus humi]